MLISMVRFITFFVMKCWSYLTCWWVFFMYTSRVILPVDNEWDIEAEDECEWYGAQLILAVGPQRLKRLSRLLPLQKEKKKLCEK